MKIWGWGDDVETGLRNSCDYCARSCAGIARGAWVWAGGVYCVGTCAGVLQVAGGCYAHSDFGASGVLVGADFDAADFLSRALVGGGQSAANPADFLDAGGIDGADFYELVHVYLFCGDEAGGG